VKRANGTFAGFLVCASKPTEALFLLVIRKADGAKPERPATFWINAIRQLIQSDAPATRPFPEQFDIDCVSVVTGVEVVRNCTDGRGATMGDTLRLLLATKAKHRVEGKRPAEPSGFYREHVQIQWEIGRVDIGVPLAGALLDDAPNVSLSLLKFIDLSIVTQLGGASANLHPAQLVQIIPFGPVRFFGFERGRENEMRHLRAPLIP
jgi:hypothetical protein